MLMFVFVLFMFLMVARTCGPCMQWSLNTDLIVLFSMLVCIDALGCEANGEDPARSAPGRV